MKRFCALMYLLGSFSLAGLSQHGTTIPDYSFKELWSFGWKEEQIVRGPCPITSSGKKAVLAVIRAQSGISAPVIVQSWIEGFFNKTGGKEQVMLVSTQSVESDHKQYFVIYDRESNRAQLTESSSALNGATSLLTTFIDPLTKRDAVLIYTRMNDGPTKAKAQLVEFNVTNKRIIKDFGAVIVDDCQAGNTDGRILRAGLLIYSEGQFQFRRRHYESSCRDRSSGALVGADDVDEEQFYRAHATKGSVQ